MADVVMYSTNVTVSKSPWAFNDTDRTALVMAVTIITSVVMLAAIIAKMAVRPKVRLLHNFDYAIIISAFFMLAQTACVISAVTAGLGRHVTDATVDHAQVQKMAYAATLLQFGVLSFSKSSLCLLIKSINGYGRVHVATMIVLALIAGSCLSGFLAVAFQCPLPTPWVAHSPIECPAIAGIYLYNGIMSIITDVMICVLSGAMIWNVQAISTKNKAMIILLFASRIICPITLAFALTNTQHLYQDHNDFTWLSSDPTFWQQLSYSFSVITACVPSMKVIFDGMLSDSIAIEMPYHLSIVAGHPGFQITPSSESHQRQTKSSAAVHSRECDGDLKLAPSLPSQAYCYTGKGLRPADKGHKNDGQSESVQNLTDDVIVVRDDVEVLFDHERAWSSGSSQ